MPLETLVLNLQDGRSVPFAFRGDSEGDRGVIQQIFGTKDYDLGQLKRGPDIAAEYERILSQGRQALIIDCGANIGASPVAFALAFPRARIVAIEPEATNFEILRRNCAQFDNIEALQAAISCVDETLCLEDPGFGHWAFRTTPRDYTPGGATTGNAVAAISIDSILKRYPGADLLCVKIDIEGGEARLFEANTAWAALPMLIIIELHDWLFTGSASSRNFLRTISGTNRDFVHIGENVFSIRND